MPSDQFIQLLNQGLANPAIGLGAGILFNNLPGGFNDQQRRFAGDIRQNNFGFDAISQGQINPAINQANTVSAIGTQLGNNFFDPLASQQRFNTSFAGVQQGLRGLQGQIGLGNQQVQNQFNTIRSRFSQQAGQLEQGFQGQLDTARGIVQNAGQQERQDINQAFTEAGSASQQNLSARGLGGTTISSNLSQGNELQRSRALGGLNDRLVGQRLGVESQFGGALLGAQQANLQTATGLGLGQVGALQQGNQFGANAQLGALGQLGGIAAGQFGAFGNAAQNQLSNQFNFGQFGVQSQFFGAGQNQQGLRSKTFIQPTPNQNPFIQHQVR